MTIKLNLTIEEDTARLIKEYAEEENTSVSKLADSYFKELVKRKEKGNKKKSFVEKYAGIIKDISISDIDKARDEYLKEKYGI